MGPARVRTARYDQAALERSNYLRHLTQGRNSYTEDGLVAADPCFGVIVLQTSLVDATAEQV